MIRVFISYSLADRELREVLANTLHTQALEVWQPRDSTGNGDLQAELLTAIKRCDVLIAIIGKSSPNVMFELGCAMGSGKTVLLVRLRNSELPLDLTTLPTITVDPMDFRSIAEIVDWVTRATIRSRPHDLMQGDTREILRRLLSDPTLLDEMEQRQFEECVTNHLIRLGMPGTLFHLSQDGGFDVDVRDFAGHRKTIVEVKKLNQNSRISVDEVQRFLGIANVHGASCAIIVTSGQFTSSAYYFAGSLPVRIVLLTLNEIVDATLESLALRCVR
jgi:Restriction endonuclease/TIR domain